MRLIIPNRPLCLIALALLIPSVCAIRIFAVDDVFTESAVWRISITIPPENISKLRRNHRQYVAATVRAFGEVYGEVGVHVKGSAGSFRPIDENPCLTLNFSRFRTESRFHGLEKIHLNNSVEDPSYFNELIGGELFRAAGVPAPRVAHAIVELNGRHLGLYVVKEGFEGDFLRRNFSQPTGNLYDIYQGHDIDRRLKRQSGLGPNSQEDLRSLATAALVPDLSERWQRFQEILDVDRFISFIALEVMIGHRDGYSLARNNFRIYHDPVSNKLVFFPAGMDQLFGKADTSWKPHMAGLVAKSIMEIPFAQKLYAERFARLLDEALRPARLCAELNTALDKLGKELSTDTFNSVRNETHALCERLHDRKKNLIQQLSRPPLKTLVFTGQEGTLRDWNPHDTPSGGALYAENAPNGTPLLEILAGPVTSASWRTSTLLKKGRYYFRGKAKTVEVAPLPFGTNQGARLRIGGSQKQSSALLGTSIWTILQLEFEIESSEEEVELICELRGSAGKAIYDRNSLKLFKVE